MAAGTDNGVFHSFVDSLGTGKNLGTDLPAAEKVHDMQFNKADHLTQPARCVINFAFSKPSTRCTFLRELELTKAS